MSDTFANVYEDAERAAGYATLSFPGTYYLAFRDLPAIIAAHVSGRKALDFGCGAGRSTRFLRELGFDATGVDISVSMIELAREVDPTGDYRLIGDGNFSALQAGSFDLVLCVFPFDNIPGVAQRRSILTGLRQLLNNSGVIIIVGSRPETYLHEWTSFSTKDFPENHSARSGEQVRVLMKDVADARPVIDVLWFHEDYLALFDTAGCELIATHTPLGRPDEPFDWVNETAVAPWFTYVVRERRPTTIPRSP